MFKIWGTGDITKEDLSNQSFLHIEAPEGTDVNNHITLQRTLRNLYELQKDTYDILINIFNTSTRSAKILKSGDFDFNIIDVNGVDYIRVKPGIAFTGDFIFDNRPLVHNASRQLEKLLNLMTWTIDSQREFVEITYDGTFSAIIKENGTTHTYNNSGAGYSTGISLLEDIQTDFPVVLNIDLTEIKLEPMFELGAGGYLGINSSGEIYFTPTSGYFDLYQIDSSGNILNDYRTYYHAYNQFENGIELNKKDEPVNADATITVKKLSGGDAVIKWNDSGSQFEINKNLDISGNIDVNEITSTSFNGATINPTSFNGLTIEGGLVNGLNITTVTNKNLDLSNASLTIGSAGNNGTISITSDSDTNRTLTLAGNTTLVDGTVMVHGDAKSYQHAVSLNVESTSIPIPTGFDKTKDTLIVFENLVYFLRPNYDYTINSTGSFIFRGDNYPSINFPTGTYIFIILKNIQMGE